MAFDERALEEKLEYSNVTQLRESLLGIVERLQRNPALRYLITKHGRPQAVLMSFQTYELLKKVMNHALERAGGKGRDEAVREAFARLRAGRRPAFDGVLGAHAVLRTETELQALRVAVRALRQDLTRLDDLLEKEEEQAPGAALAE